jgi:hypothetical protein
LILQPLLKYRGGFFAAKKTTPFGVVFGLKKEGRQHVEKKKDGKEFLHNC